MAKEKLIKSNVGPDFFFLHKSFKSVLKYTLKVDLIKAESAGW